MADDTLLRFYYAWIIVYFQLLKRKKVTVSKSIKERHFYDFPFG